MISIYILGTGLLYFIQIYYYILVARIILSWFRVSFYGNPSLAGIYRILYGLTEPVLAPLRKVLPTVRMGMGYLDLSPIVLLVLLALLRQLVAQYLF
ncbi:MAG: YggT family protein [Dethiobacter sp.]|nr:YggT family protein [Dethiobacter sp.]